MSELSSPQHIEATLSQASHTISGTLSSPRTLNANLQRGAYGIPTINGVPLVGDLSLSDLRIVSENTEAGWESNSMYVPKRGELCIYTDTLAIKVGDGNVPIVDLPYIGDNTSEILDTLKRHTDDQAIHVSQEDRDRWDAKLNYIANGENLIFTRE